MREVLAAVFAGCDQLRGYVVEDQGAYWQLIDAHLPPIYSVRFG